MLSRSKLIKVSLIFLLFTTALFASGVGAARIGNLFDYFSADYDPASKLIMESIRTPRILTAISAGFLMALAGLIMQRVFNNPLAEPTILGTTAAASLGSIIAIALGISGSNLFTLFGASALSAILLSFIIISLSTKVKAKNLTLIITGFAFAALLNGLISIISAATGNQQIRSLTFWTAGTLAYSTFSTFYLLLSVTLLTLVLLKFLQNRFDLLSVSPIQNLLININPVRTKMLGLLIVAIAVAAVTVSVGAIAFIGLAAPYIGKAIFGVSIKDNFLATALIGSILLLVSDTIARGLIPPTELPISVVTSLIGGPVLLAIILKKSSWQNA
jgi:iron complex transport system permease protein